MFSVTAKMLSKILLGKKYLSRSGKGKGLRKRRSNKSDMGEKKPDADDDDNQLPAPKEARSMVKGRPN